MALAPVVTDRTDVVAAAPERVWEVFEDVTAYPTFWPWLRSFDGRSLVPGEGWHGTIAASGLLRLHVVVHIGEVTPGRRVRAQIGGDLLGTAAVDLAPHADGTALRLRAGLVPRRRSLRALTRTARPVAQASHDRVIARALAQLAAHLAP